MENTVYIFDFDGTILNSMPVGVKMLLDFLEEYGVSYPANIIDVLLPLGYKGIAAYYANTMGVPLTAEETYDCFMQRLGKAYAEEIPLKEGAKEALTTLKARGARLCLLTASPHFFVDPCLRRTGLSSLFECVWTTEDFGTSKGDVRIYRAAAEQLQVPAEEILFVDDGLHVLEVAKRAGLRTVGVYEAYSTSTEAEVRAVADGYVRTLTELL